MADSAPDILDLCRQTEHLLASREVPLLWVADLSTCRKDASLEVPRNPLCGGADGSEEANNRYKNHPTSIHLSQGVL